MTDDQPKSGAPSLVPTPSLSGEAGATPIRQLDALRDFVSAVYEWAATADDSAATTIYCFCEGAEENLYELRQFWAAPSPSSVPKKCSCRDEDTYDDPQCELHGKQGASPSSDPPPATPRLMRCLGDGPGVTHYEDTDCAEAGCTPSATAIDIRCLHCGELLSKGSFDETTIHVEPNHLGTVSPTHQEGTREHPEGDQPPTTQEVIESEISHLLWEFRSVETVTDELASKLLRAAFGRVVAASAPAPPEKDAMADLLTNVCQILDTVKGEWGDAWSEWDQHQRDACGKWLMAYHGMLPDATSPAPLEAGASSERVGTPRLDNPSDNRNDTMEYWRARAVTAEQKLQSFAEEIDKIEGSEGVGSAEPAK
jgi:hypothetical protein